MCEGTLLAAACAFESGHLTLVSGAGEGEGCDQGGWRGGELSVDSRPLYMYVITVGPMLFRNGDLIRLSPGRDGRCGRGRGMVGQDGPFHARVLLSNLIVNR